MIRREILIGPITQCLVRSLLTALNYVHRKVRFVALLNSHEAQIKIMYVRLTLEALAKITFF